MEILDHITVYRKSGRYAGWPANYGIWAWGDEIVTGFFVGVLAPGAGDFHPRDRSKPFRVLQARTVDGGWHWIIAPSPAPSPGQRAFSADEHVVPRLRIGPLLAAMPPFPGLDRPADFTHPDFALLCARSGLALGARSWFYLSYDRARHWMGPYGLPNFGLPGVAARTDYQVLGRHRCLLFLSGAKPDGNEGRVFSVLTEDGGMTFHFQGWIGDAGGPSDGYAIMPASVRLPDGRLLVAVRRRGGGKAGTCWIDLWRSEDEGQHWEYLGRPESDTGRGGNPPSLVGLPDGRLCLTYGVRRAPYRVCARLSEDGGRSWGPALVLRSEGGNHDVGYPRTAVRSDGALVTVYYWNDDPRGERYIAATLWRA